MADLSDAQLAELVELANERLDAKAASADAPAPTPTPTMLVVEVRSELTGARIGRWRAGDIDADAEARRLNDEARRYDIRHEGKSMRYYATEPFEVDDEVSAAAMRVERVRGELDAADPAERESLEGVLEQAEANLDAVTDNA